MLILIVARGPEKGQLYELRESRPIVLGREGDPFAFHDTHCSRQHARIWCEAGQWFIEDCHSDQGTFLNDRRIAGMTPLQDDDRVQVGRTVFNLVRMPVEQAERTALLGDPPGRSRLRVGQPVRIAVPRSVLLATAAAAMVAIVVGVNAYQPGDLHHEGMSFQLLADRAEPQAVSAADDVLAINRFEAPTQGKTPPHTAARKHSSPAPDPHRFMTHSDRQAFATSLKAMEASAAQFQQPIAMSSSQSHDAMLHSRPGTGPVLPRLTRTEQAYKTAFETGEPVRIGEGAVNPLTGEIAEGRLLDPSAAKAAGITHWRDWYVQDDYQERIRLQRQAIEYLRQSGPRLVTLPVRLPPTREGE